jgi:hypothetical protein
MANELDILAEIEGLANTPSAPVSNGSDTLGYLRSIVAGPTFNFGDAIEARMGAGLGYLGANLPTSLGGAGASIPYSQILGERQQAIQSEQAAFKQRHPVASTATEIASGLFLNPLGAIGLATKGAKGLKTVSTLASSPIVQSAVNAYGASDQGSELKDTLLGAGLGLTGAGLSSVIGKTAEAAGKNADKLKLSAYGIGTADINKQLKKAGDAAFVAPDSVLPITKIVEKAEKSKIIDASKDSFENVQSVLKAQNAVAGELNKALKDANKVVPASKNFNFNNTLKYIDGLSGSAKEQAEEAAINELSLISKQMTTGDIYDLQKAKIGLNYKFDQNAYKEDVIKNIRSDLREEIENRIDLAVKAKKLPADQLGKIKALNRSYGDLAELKDPLVKQVGREFGTDAVDSIFADLRSSGGVGTLVNAGQTGGGLMSNIAAAALSLARVPETKSKLADVLSEFQTPLKAVGEGLQEYGNAKSFSQMYPAYRDSKKEQSQTPIINNNQQPNVSSGQLLQEIEALMGAKQESTSTTSANPLVEMGMEQATKTSPRLLDSIRKVESNDGDPRYMLSNKGAIGPYQIMPDTGKTLIKRRFGVDIDGKDLQLALMDEATARLLADDLMQENLQRFGDEDLAIAAYNAGAPAVAKYGGIPPFKETKDYVKKVNKVLGLA